MQTKKIKIAGAGIAGLTAGIVLSKAGYEVEIFEKGKDVGSRFNNDFQGIMNWGFEDDAIEFIESIGLGNDFWKKVVQKIDIFSPAENKNSFNLNRPFVFLVKRGAGKDCLDYHLKKKALENGVKIKFDSLVKDFDKVDIVATGPDFEKTNVMAVGYTFDVDAKDISSAIFDNNFSYKGYSYFFISEGKGTIATCCFGKFDKMPFYLEKTVNFF